MYRCKVKRESYVECFAMEGNAKIESFNPQWEYRRKYGHFQVFFEATTPDGPVSVVIQEGYTSVGTSSPIRYDGFTGAIKNGTRNQAAA